MLATTSRANQTIMGGGGVGGSFPGIPSLGVVVERHLLDRSPHRARASQRPAPARQEPAMPFVDMMQRVIELPVQVAFRSVGSMGRTGVDCSVRFENS